jgi:hypothetical protein
MLVRLGLRPVAFKKAITSELKIESWDSRLGSPESALDSRAIHPFSHSGRRSPISGNPAGSERPSLDWSAVGGGTWGRFGIVGAVSFSNQPQSQSELQRYLREGAGAPIIFTDYPDYREYTESERIGRCLQHCHQFEPEPGADFPEHLHTTSTRVYANLTVSTGRGKRPRGPRGEL